MQFFSNTKQHLLVLEKGEEIFEQLNIFLQQHPDIRCLWISGIGAARSVTMSFFDPKTQKYIDKVIDEDLEILSLQGNVSFINNTPRWHIHGTFSDKDYRALGGHVQSLTIGVTCEIMMLELPFSLTRSFNTDIGAYTLTEKK